LPDPLGGYADRHIDVRHPLAALLREKAIEGDGDPRPLLGSLGCSGMGTGRDVRGNDGQVAGGTL
jgi:hypothetical protein